MTMFYKIPELNANSVYPVRTPRSAVSELGLHCLPISLYRTLGLIGFTYFVNAAENDWKFMFYLKSV